MTRFDYSGLIASASTIITSFGAPAVAVLAGTSPTSSDKDWRGADCGGTLNVNIELAVTDFEDDEVDGDRVRRTDKQGWTFPPATGEDLRNATSVVQDNVRYSVEHVMVIKPATQVLAYRLTLRR